MYDDIDDWIRKPALTSPIMVRSVKQINNAIRIVVSAKPSSACISSTRDDTMLNFEHYT